MERAKERKRRSASSPGIAPSKCRHCGGDVPYLTRAAYCHEEGCQQEKKRAQWRRENRRKRAREQRERAAYLLANPLPHCANCGVELRHHDAVYCSAKACQQVRRRKWFEDNHELRREYNRKNKAKRRALRREAVTDDVTWTGIMERDHWTCQLCGEHIDQTMKSPDPMSPTWDHIVPLSEGGDHTWANLQAAHYGCNSRKSNRGGPQQLALI